MNKLNQAYTFGAVGVLSSYIVAKASQFLPLVGQQFTYSGGNFDPAQIGGSVILGLSAAVVGTVAGAASFKKAVDCVNPEFWDRLADHKLGQFLIEVNETFGNWSVFAAKTGAILAGSNALLSPVGEPLTTPAVVSAAAILPLTLMRGLAQRREAAAKKEQEMKLNSAVAYTKPRLPGR